jgi:methyl-accepting chemotaxis protein
MAIFDKGGMTSAINRSMAVIEFDLDGTILDANENFLKTMGYSLAEIKGRHHRMFVAPETADSQAYRDFWARLARGEYDAGQYGRVSKSGATVWLQASYNPVFNLFGRPVRVVKIASDITAQAQASANFGGQIAAIDKAMAVIEFELDGTIITANANFLATMGYSLEEIRGRHHRMFADPADAAAPQYRDFWARLARGEYDAGQYRRLGKGGREVWLQASYNPIRDTAGRPFKVVKFATDITAQKQANANFEGQIAAIDKAMAVIEFELDGTIRTANANFLAALGYRLDEVKGRHHSIFVPRDEAAAPQYRAFWAKLAQGRYDSGQYRRIAKDGSDVWIQASYNPILDSSGRPFKVVKYATDVTAQTRAMHTIMDASTTIASASNEILAASQDLAERTESQAATVEQTAASMHEVTQTVRQTAQNAEAANRGAAEATAAANDGGRIMAQVTGAMGALEKSA